MGHEVSFFVVEDHTLTNRGIRELISERGRYSYCRYAFSKNECIKKLYELAKESRLPDILILDLFLGDESGLDILREVKANLPSVKVIVYSMFAKPGIVSLALEGDADGFVLKSAPESALFTPIAALLAGNTYAPQTPLAALFTH